MSIEAGWYADPTDVSQVRWWDGGQWTTHAQPAPVPEPVAVIPPEQMPVPLLEPLAPVAPVAPVTPVVTPTLAPVEHRPADAEPALEPTPTLAPERELVSAGRVETPVTLADRTPASAYTAPAVQVRPAPPESAEPVYHRTEERPVRPQSSPSSATGQDRWGATTSATANDTGWSTGGTTWDHATTSAVHPATRSTKRTIVIGVVIGVLVIGLVFLAAAVGMPALLNQRARAAAADQPVVLTHTAPAKLVGRSPIRVPGFSAAAASSAARQMGAAWAWAGVYGTTTHGYVLYVASDVPDSGVAEAYRAQTDTGIAKKIFASANKGMVEASGGAITLGGVEKYATSVTGTTWCAPLTISGRSAAYCMWTDGREMLQMLRLPSDAPGAAVEFDKALSQMSAAVGRTK